MSYEWTILANQGMTLIVLIDKLTWLSIYMKSLDMFHIHVHYILVRCTNLSKHGIMSEVLHKIVHVTLVKLRS